jgi:GTP-binding protein LepA
MRRMYTAFERESRKSGDFSALPELHATSSGLKALCSWRTKDGIEACRLACGGHGYMSMAGFGSTFSNYAPNVTYEILNRKGEVIVVDNPQKVPDAGQIEEFREPFIRINFLVPSENIGDIMKVCTERRGSYIKTDYLSPIRAMVTFEMPLAEVIYDLFDKLKSMTKGYGTMDYEVIGFRSEDLVRLDILVAGKRVDALSTIVHRSTAEVRGRRLIKKMREEIDRHLFEVVLQAAIGSRIVARESISAMRKNVTAKCYGGDISRKRKLLSKQAEGKKRMKQIGQVDIPQEAFLAVLETGE